MIMFNEIINAKEVIARGYADRNDENGRPAYSAALSRPQKNKPKVPNRGAYCHEKPVESQLAAIVDHKVPEGQGALGEIGAGSPVDGLGPGPDGIDNGDHDDAVVQAAVLAD